MNSTIQHYTGIKDRYCCVVMYRYNTVPSASFLKAFVRVSTVVVFVLTPATSDVLLHLSVSPFKTS